jgi:hypothetical protein
MKIILLFFTFFILGCLSVLIMNQIIGIDFHSSFLKNIFVTFKVMGAPEYLLIAFFLMFSLFRPLSLFYKRLSGKDSNH